MQYFERILTHYIVTALRRSGGNIDSDIYAELSGAFDEIKDLAAEVAALRAELDQLKADHAALDEVVDGTFERMEAVGR